MMNRAPIAIAGKSSGSFFGRWVMPLMENSGSSALHSEQFESPSRCSAPHDGHTIRVKPPLLLHHPNIRGGYESRHRRPTPPDLDHVEPLGVDLLWHYAQRGDRFLHRVHHRP